MSRERTRSRGQGSRTPKKARPARAGSAESVEIIFGEEEEEDVVVVSPGAVGDRGEAAEEELFDGLPPPPPPPTLPDTLPTYLMSPASTATCDSDTESDLDSGFSDEEGSGSEDYEPAEPRSSGAERPITAVVLQRKMSKRKYVLLDCRLKKEYDECHIYGSIHLDEESWSDGSVTNIINQFKGMENCHFALIGSGPDQFDLQMSVNAHRCGPSKWWKRKQRAKNQASDVVKSSNKFFSNLLGGRKKDEETQVSASRAPFNLPPYPFVARHTLCSHTHVPSGCSGPRRRRRSRRRPRIHASGRRRRGGFSRVALGLHVPAT